MRPQVGGGLEKVGSLVVALFCHLFALDLDLIASHIATKRTDTMHAPLGVPERQLSAFLLRILQMTDDNGTIAS